MVHGHRFLLHGWRLKRGFGCQTAGLEFMDWRFPDRGCKLTSSGDDKGRIRIPRLARYCWWMALGG